MHAIAHLAGEHRGIDLVELLKAFGHGAGGHACEAVQRAPDHLVVHGAERLADPHGLGCERRRRFRVAVVQQREDSAAQREPRMFGRIGLPFQKAVRPLEPSVRNGLFTAERGRIPGEPDRQTRRAHLIVTLAIQAVRALADVEHDVGLIEPPGREPQALERLGRFLDLQRRIEREARRRPVAAGKRCPARIKTVQRKIALRIHRGKY